MDNYGDNQGQDHLIKLAISDKFSFKARPWRDSKFSFQLSNPSSTLGLSFILPAQLKMGKGKKNSAAGFETLAAEFWL